MKLTPHFTFDGQSEEAMNFYCKVFGGEIISLARFSDAAGENSCMQEMKPEHGNLILNGCIGFGGNTICCCDQLPGNAPCTGNNVMMDICSKDGAETARIFGALSEQGTVVVPLSPTPWSAAYGMATDRYGICWNIMQEL